MEMFYLISGGSGSGKSEYAEAIAVRLAQKEKREKAELSKIKKDIKLNEKKMHINLKIALQHLKKQLK